MGKTLTSISKYLIVILLLFVSVTVSARTYYFFGAHFYTTEENKHAPENLLPLKCYVSVNEKTGIIQLGIYSTGKKRYEKYNFQITEKMYPKKGVTLYLTTNNVYKNSYVYISSNYRGYYIDVNNFKFRDLDFAVWMQGAYKIM